MTLDVGMLEIDAIFVKWASWTTFADLQSVLSHQAHATR